MSIKIGIIGGSGLYNVGIIKDTEEIDGWEVITDEQGYS